MFFEILKSVKIFWLYCSTKFEKVYDLFLIIKIMNLQEFSKSVVNRSNNKGKINYEKLYKLLGWECPENLHKLDSKSNEKKSARKLLQKYILDFAFNVDKKTLLELKELHDTLVEVQGEYNSAKELYNASTLEKEDAIKKLFARLQTAKAKNFKQAK